MRKNYTSKLFFILVFFCCSIRIFSQSPGDDGQWGPVIPFEIVPVAVANLPDGRLITWSSQFPNTWLAAGTGMTYTQLFDPATDNTLPSTVTQTDHDMFCPGINNLSDGRILSAGGTTSERTSIYDPVTNVWSEAADMNVPRGYQGNVTLSDGSVFTVGGSWDAGPDGSKNAELWTQETGWVYLPGIASDDFLYNTNDRAFEYEGVFRLDNHVWLWPAPNGKLFQAGPGEEMHWIDVVGNNGTGSWVSAGQRADDTYSMKGTTVMFDTGRILKVGGSRSYDSNTPAKERSFVIDINGTYGSIPAVTETANTLEFARTMHNSTVLPNGEVLVTGGLDHAETFTDVGAALTAEIYNPVTNSWRSVAGMATPRTYHSVAILMLDGRVFVGGGGLCDNTPGCVNNDNAEIYSPPYLFDGSGNLATRPEIMTVPATADYNSNISVTTDTNVTEFSLIRFSAATHSTNNEQRRIPLTTTGGTSHSLTIPDRNLLPPGYYMLFALDANGVPSEAKAIQIGSDIPLATNPSLILDLKFDDAPGANAADDSQYNNDAIVYDVDNAGAQKVENTTSIVPAEGLFGGALRTDGAKFQSNTIAEIPYSESLGSITRFVTVMAWVNRDEIVNNASIYSNDYPNTFFGFHNSLYKWEFFTEDGQASCYAGYTPSSQWVHMAATYDGNMARLYANGVEICAKPITGDILVTSADANPNFNAFSTSGFYERRTNPSGDYNGSGVTDELDGRIDELKVYNKVLSAEEIREVFEVGEALAEVTDCPEGTIVTEFKIGASGTWTESPNINAPEGSEVYIRAKDYVGDYFVTTPEIDGNTFMSTADFNTADGYRLDTGTNRGNNDGLVNVDDSGQYILTTADGCPAVINLTVIGTCGPGDTQIESEFRINGDWDTPLNGQTEITLEEGTELWLSATPNEVNGSNLLITITLPNGDVVGDDYNLGPVSETSQGTYIISSQEGCSVAVVLTVSELDCSTLGLQSEYKINDNLYQIDNPTATLPEGAELTLSIAPENTIFSVTDPNGTEVYNGSTNYIIDNVNVADHDGLFTLTTAAGCFVTVDVTVEPVDCANVMTEYQINSGLYQEGETQVDVEENARLALSIAPNDIPFTVTLPDGSVENVRAGLDYVIEAIALSQSGTYTFNTPVSDCTLSLDVTVAGIDCDAIDSEYQINQNLFQINEPTAEMDEGSRLTLSIEPDDAPYTITLPNGTVENVAANTDFVIENVDQTHNGDFILTAQNGCEKTITVIVNEIDCSEVAAEYRVGDTPWVSNATEVTVDEGQQLLISLFPNDLPYMITDPSGMETNFASGLENYTIASAAQSDAGIYILTTSGTGCSVSLNVNVNNPACTAINLRPEYSINGGDFVEGTAGGSLVLNEGDMLVLSALPDMDNGTAIPVTITLPNGTEVTDGHEITSLTATDEGSYLFTTDIGCTTSLQVIVNPAGTDCAEVNLVPEYSINGAAFQAGTDGETLTLTEGDGIVFSASPDEYNGLPVNVTLTLPDTSFESDGYEIASLTSADNGVYTFTSDSGCTTTLNLVVNEDEPSECTSTSITPEYFINDQTTQSGGESILLPVGSSLVLRIVQDDAFTILLPDGSEVTGEYTLESIQMSDAGVYTFTSEQGCTTRFNISVTEEEASDAPIEDMIVYPNPVRDGMLHFALQDYMGQEIRVQINDVYGKTILRKIFQSTHQADEVIDISILNEGMYIVIITRNTDNEVAFKKVMKLGGL